MLVVDLSNQLKCTNQIGVVVDGAVTSNYIYEGFLKCNATIPNLNINSHYWVVYSDALNGYSKFYQKSSSEHVICVLQYGCNPLCTHTHMVMIKSCMTINLIFYCV